MSSGQFSTDITFLLACLTLQSDKYAEQLPPIPNSWDSIVRLASDHGVTALVYAHLKTGEGQVIPALVMQQWQREATQQKLFNHTISVEMHHILDQFASAQIPVLVFKGPALATQLYGNIYSRPFGDIDLLLEREQMMAASQLLIADGYVLSSGTLPTALPRLGYHYDFKHRTRHSEIELHWAVAPAYLRFPLEFDRLWDRAVEVKVLDKHVRTPSPEDMLLILCIHGSKHGWVRLSWVCDIGAMVRAYPTMDWQRMLRQASMLHCRRMLLVAMYLAADLLKSALPKPISEAVRKDSQVVSLTQQVKSWLFAPDDSHYFEKHAFQIKVRDHLGDKYLYVKVKQPFLEEDAPLFYRPEMDRGLFYLLWANRLVRKYAVRPVLRFIERLRTRVGDQPRRG